MSVRKIELMKFKVDSASGQYLSAITHFQKFKNLSDSIFNATKSRQITEMLVKYQSEQKEQSINILKIQSLKEHSEVRSANLARNITFGGVGMLLFIAGLIYNGYRNKQRSNLILQTKQLEINQKNLILQDLLFDKDKLLTDKDQLLLEKDWLIKEVHHRVKNNLQIVMSLLNSQSAYLQNSDALKAIRESQNRVQAISLIHQKFYSSNNLATINLPAYVEDLLNHLSESFDTRKRHITFKQFVEPVNIDLSQAVPLGLILNESITNAIKYAFENGGGQISVSLLLIKEDYLSLTIADNGKGLPANFDAENNSTLGMEMMKALSKQLGGEFKVQSDAGVTISMDFKIEKDLNMISQGGTE
ncbi:sensor histidine kinase [Mucilaginibacter antarcticus]|uniref:sensor histidine kinase n=1 Tax=Mucilaginibacter antarcticus TaxID=1855725 RepID=UPI0036267190